MKRARTTIEMDFAASLVTCPSCGTHDAAHLSMRGSGDTWFFSGSCLKCGAARTFEFRSLGGTPGGDVPSTYELGEGPSELIDPTAFLAEEQRVAALVPADPTSLALEPWRAAKDLIRRGFICLAELAKQVPPSGALAGDARLSRDWVEGERKRLRALMDRYNLEQDRHMKSVPTKQAPVGTLDRAALVAHQAWVRRGRTGDGRLVLEHHEHVGIKLGAAELTGVRFVDCDFGRAELAYITFDEAELVDVKLDRANLDGARFKTVRATGGSWTWAKIAVTRFDGAQIRGTDFTSSDLERATWDHARVEDATFAKVRFGNSTFDGAVFTKCDMRTARFARIQRLPEPTSKGARFEDCDLRETQWQGRDLSSTTFVRCKLAGAHGSTTSTEGLTVEDCDVTVEQLRKQVM